MSRIESPYFRLLQMKYAAIKIRITKSGMITATAIISGAVPPELPSDEEVEDEVAVVVVDVVDAVVVVLLRSVQYVSLKSGTSKYSKLTAVSFTVR